MKQKTIYTIALAFLLLLAAGCADQSNNSDSFAEDFESGEVQLTQEGAVTFSDGETADLYRWDIVDSDVYLLADGTRLLTVIDPAWPEQASESSVAQLEDLDDQARTAITTYYEQQGALYDESEEVDKAYEEYLRCQTSNETYAEDRTVSQETSGTFSNQYIICFQTTVSLPLEGETAQQTSYSAVFDVETGETVSQWELFDMTESEARTWLAEAAGEDAGLCEEIASELEPEYICLFPDRLEVRIPAGVLSSQETGYSIVIDYDDEVLSQLAEWARPED